MRVTGLLFVLVVIVPAGGASPTVGVPASLMLFGLWRCARTRTPQQAPTVKPQQAQDPTAPAAEKSFAQLSKDKRPSQTDVTPYVELYLNQRPQQHAVDLAEVNALTQTLLELAEETEIKINTLQEFAHCVLASGTREVCDELWSMVTPISDV